MVQNTDLGEEYIESLYFQDDYMIPLTNPHYSVENYQK